MVGSRASPSRLETQSGLSVWSHHHESGPGKYWVTTISLPILKRIRSSPTTSGRWCGKLALSLGFQHEHQPRDRPAVFAPERDRVACFDAETMQFGERKDIALPWL
jgi:hypothetical protein